MPGGGHGVLCAIFVFIIIYFYYYYYYYEEGTECSARYSCTYIYIYMCVYIYSTQHEPGA